METSFIEFKKVVNIESLNRRLGNEGLVHEMNLLSGSKPLINPPSEMSDNLDLFFNLPLMLLDEKDIFD